MHMQLLAGAIGALSLFQPADTTIAVEPGTQLAVENQEGSVLIRAWDRPSVQVRTAGGDMTGLEVSLTGRTLRVRPERPGDDDFDLELMVPEEMPVEIRAPFSDVTVEGTRAAVAVESVEGDVSVTGGAAGVAVRTIEGDVVVEGARASVAISSADGDIALRDVEGSVAVEAIDGDVDLAGVDSDNVQVTTVDGDVRFVGPIRDGGRYRLATHDGDIVCTVPEGANVTVSVATFAGDFEASFPIAIQGSVDRRFQFTLGSGSARLELEAFDGEIRLIRPGEDGTE